MVGPVAPRRGNLLLPLRHHSRLLLDPLLRRERLREEEGDRGVVTCSHLHRDDRREKRNPGARADHPLQSLLRPRASGNRSGRTPGGGGFCSRRTSYTSPSLALAFVRVVRLPHPLGAVMELLAQCHRDGLLLVPKSRAQPPLPPPPRGARATNMQRHVDSWSFTQRKTRLCGYALEWKRLVVVVRTLL